MYDPNIYKRLDAIEARLRAIEPSEQDDASKAFIEEFLRGIPDMNRRLDKLEALVAAIAERWPPPAELVAEPDTGDWEWAKARMDEGKCVELINDPPGPIRVFFKHEQTYVWMTTKKMTTIGRKVARDNTWFNETFRVVTRPEWAK